MEPPEPPMLDAAELVAPLDGVTPETPEGLLPEPGTREELSTGTPELEMSALLAPLAADALMPEPPLPESGPRDELLPTNGLELESMALVAPLEVATCDAAEAAELAETAALEVPAPPLEELEATDDVPSDVVGQAPSKPAPSSNASARVGLC